MSRNSRSEQRKSELIKQQSLIEQKKIEIAKKNQARELLLSFQENNKSEIPNDGSFFEKFKLLTGSTSSSNSTNENLLSATLFSSSLQQQHLVPPPPLAIIPSSSIINHQQNQVRQQQLIELSEIPPPKELDLSSIPKPRSLRLDEIRMPPEGTKIKIPKSKVELIELVAANGDGYEENLVTKCNKDDFDSQLKFLFDKNCEEYLDYRREVTELRKMDKYDPLDELQYEDYKKAPSMMVTGPKTFGSTQEKVAKNVTVIRNDDSESTNSDTETWSSMKERNLKNLKRKAIHSRTRKQQEASTTDSSDDNDSQHKDSSRYYDRKYKMSSTASSSSSNSKKSNDLNLHPKQPQLQQQQQSSSTQHIQDIQVDHPNQQPHNSDKNSESSTRPPKRKKSRWSEVSATGIEQGIMTATSTHALTTLPSSSATTTAAVHDLSKPPMLSTVTRSDPSLLNYARQNFGTINLTEEEWQKAEEHYKINLLFQDMQRKRQEIEQLAKNGKFKYEYDSDEDVNGGTWEHKLRAQEMEATIRWANALNNQCHGKHHIGDFLPPEELKKFMEKYEAQKDQSKPPDVSDYKEFKLKEDNIGYKMLQKLGWKGDGTSLGASGSGIIEPINKAAPRESLQGLGANVEMEAPNENDNEYDIYRKRMMLAYRFRPNPLNNPRRAYY